MIDLPLLDLVRSPWPWYVAGPLIGLAVPLALLVGNRSFGLSSNLRHLCAVALPRRARPAFFRHDWRAERWNLAVALGITIAGLVAGAWLANPEPVAVSAATRESLAALGVEPRPGELAPAALFGPAALASPRALLYLALSGLLVGFGARWAGGCTSGHAITGLSTFQLPSLLAVLGFFAGGLVGANLLLPVFLP